MLLIAVLILVFFGAKRIPDLMRSIGKGIRNFKEGVNGIEAELDKPAGKDGENTGNK